MYATYFGGGVVLPEFFLLFLPPLWPFFPDLLFVVLAVVAFLPEALVADSLRPYRRLSAPGPESRPGTELPPMSIASSFDSPIKFWFGVPPFMNTAWER